MNGRRSLRAYLFGLLRTYRGVVLVLPLLVALGFVLVQLTTALGRPQALAGLVSVSMLVLLLGYDAWWRRQARRRFADPGLLARMAEPSLTPGLVLRALLLTAALVLIALAAARPKGQLSESTVTGAGVDLVVALDVSNSMRVADMGTRARLDVAKELIGDFADRSVGDRIALEAFAGSAHILCPFTLDRDTFRTFLKDVDYDSVAQQGTDLGEAIGVALDRFDPNSEVGQVIVMLTDGEDQGGGATQAAAAARERGVVLYTVGLGTPQGGPIPMGVDPWGNPILKKFAGKTVSSHLDEAALARLAKTTGGSYYRADSPERLDRVLSGIGKMATKVTRSTQVELREELFVWYLLPALALLAVEPFVLFRRRRKERAR